MPIVWRTVWSAAVALALTVSWGGWLDARGAAHLDAALERALVSFALSRTLNGVISVVQETHVALQPAGVGVTLAPGEILDPLNDLIERFSYVMLASSAALGVERVLLTMSSWRGVTVTLGVTAALWLVATWLGPRAARWRVAASRLLLAVLFVRFAIPLLLIATHLVSSTFLDAQATRASDALRVTSDEAHELSEDAGAAAAPPAKEQSMLERFTAGVKSLDMEERVNELRERLSGAVGHIIDLIVVFLLETVLVPLALLWLFVQVLKALLRGAWWSAPREMQ